MLSPSLGNQICHKWTQSFMSVSTGCMSRTCLMEKFCLAVLPFYLSYQLALATFSIQQMFIEPELEFPISLSSEVPGKLSLAVARDNDISAIMKMIVNINVSAISVAGI